MVIFFGIITASAIAKIMTLPKMNDKLLSRRRSDFEHWFDAHAENAKRLKYFKELWETKKYCDYHKDNPQSLPDGTPVIQNINLEVYPIKSGYEFTEPEEILPLMDDCAREKFADDGSLKAVLGYYALYLRLKNPYRWRDVPPRSGDKGRVKDMYSKKRFDYTKEYDKVMSKVNAKQIVVYGAPGTGKSFFLNKEIGTNEVFRTTFHPDSDYSTFVGAYKPTALEDGTISYNFLPQSFVDAYIKAWTFKAKATKATGTKPVFLVIEEINRGNCAQIFGDLFQLLDRNGYGYSEYPVNPDADLARYLKKMLGSVSFDEVGIKTEIDGFYDKVDGITQKVFEGQCLLLPENFYIWATMNTSDQSLFPIDSAFKRRWDWKYVPIAKPDKSDDSDWKDRKIKVGEALYDWWDFLTVINKYIQKTTESEDKQLGYFFVKADEATGIITAEQFANKVLFYLYGDVFKSYELPKDAFKNADGTMYSFRDFFYDTKDGDKVPGDVREGILSAFLDNLKIQKVPIAKAASAAAGAGDAAPAGVAATAMSAPAVGEGVAPAEATASVAPAPTGSETPVAGV